MLSGNKRHQPRSVSATLSPPEMVPERPILPSSPPAPLTSMQFICLIAAPSMDAARPPGPSGGSSPCLLIASSQGFSACLAWSCGGEATRGGRVLAWRLLGSQRWDIFFRLNGMNRDVEVQRAGRA
jgi:hypothetical protein